MIQKDYSSVNPKPFFYMTFYEMLRKIAMDHGYALAVHGSMVRDMDMIAVPWVDDVKPYEEMVLKMCEAMGGFMQDQDNNGKEQKPHGRMAYTIHVGGGGFIDLSIMVPRG